MNNTSTLDVHRLVNRIQCIVLVGLCTTCCLSSYGQSLRANAGLGQHLQLPNNYTSIYGGYSKAGATPIQRYTWKQISGPNQATLDSTISSTGICHLANMAAGTYQFELTVKDQAGQSDKDTLSVSLSACNYNSALPKSITYPASGSISQIYFPVNAQTAFHVLPGDTIKIDASRITGGTLSTFEIGNLHGCPGQPITITNLNGQILISKMVLGSDDTTRMHMGDTRVSHVNIMGNGEEDITYGFKVGAGGISVNFASNTRLSACEVGGGGIGFYVKVNNQNAGQFEEQKSYPNWWLRDIEIDHSYVHDIKGEGMYLGHTDPTAVGYCTGCTMAVQGDSLAVHDNIVENTQYDGIQISGFHTTTVYKNSISQYGLSNINNQRAGIIIGRLTRGIISSNLIKDGPGSGMQVFGYDTIRIENNFIDSAGYASKENALLANNISNAPFATIPGQMVIFDNNTVKYYNAETNAKAFLLANYLPGASPAQVTNNKWCLGANPPSNWLVSKIVADAPGLSQSNNILICSTRLPYSKWPLDTAAQITSVTLGTNSTLVPDNTKEFQVHSFPNPVSSMVEISIDCELTGTGAIIIFDQSGRILKQWSFNKQQSSFTQNLDLTDLSAGLYFLRVEVADRQSVMKIAKN